MIIETTRQKLKIRSIFVMLAASPDVFKLIIRHKYTAYKLSAVCKQLRAQVRAAYSISKNEETVTITGPYHKWEYTKVAAGPFCVATYRVVSKNEDAVYELQESCMHCGDKDNFEHVFIDDTPLHAHELAFAVRGETVTVFCFDRINSFIYAVQAYGSIYRTLRVEYSFRDPGCMYLGMDNPKKLHVRGGDTRKIVLEPVTSGVWYSAN